MLTHNRTSNGHKATKTRRESNYPTIKNFFRLTVPSCFLKAFTDEAVRPYNSVTQTVPRNSICIKIFRSICIARIRSFDCLRKTTSVSLYVSYVRHIFRYLEALTDCMNCLGVVYTTHQTVTRVTDRWTDRRMDGRSGLDAR